MKSDPTLEPQRKAKSFLLCHVAMTNGHFRISFVTPHESKDLKILRRVWKHIHAGAISTSNRNGLGVTHYKFPIRTIYDWCHSQSALDNKTHMMSVIHEYAI